MRFLLFIAIIFPYLFAETRKLTIPKSERSFGLGKNEFMKDGKPFKILSGTIHYFRIVPDQWMETLLLAKQAGLNTIETYIPWSLHQPDLRKPLDFSGILNVTEFLETAKKLELNVLIRIGPFNDAELDYGGLPIWLIAKDIPIRTNNKYYLMYVSEWVETVGNIISPYLYENGGNILMIQVENEYGLVGCDNSYIKQLYLIFRHIFPLSLLYTTDPCRESVLRCGNGNKTTPLFATVDFGPKVNATECAQLLRTYQPIFPIMNSEFYTGWFSKYGSTFSRGNPDEFKSQLISILKNDFSVNFYVFRGGSNFGFIGGTIAPREKLITSYDYDAPLNEAGEPTKKYEIIKSILLSESTHPAKQNLNTNLRKTKSYGKFNITSIVSAASLFPFITSGGVILKKSEEYLEHYNFWEGFTLFTTRLPKFQGKGNLTINNLFDEVVLIANENYLARSDGSGKMVVSIGQEFSDKRILLLHLNYGHFAMCSRLEYKTLGSVLFNGHAFSEWIASHVDLEKITKFIPQNTNKKLTARSFNPKFSSLSNTPLIVNITFDLESIFNDTYLYPGECFQTGYAFVNGQNIGYYNNLLPPQYTLYVPSAFLKKGHNEIVMFEYYYLKNADKFNSCQIYLREDQVFTSVMP